MLQFVIQGDNGFYLNNDEQPVFLSIRGEGWGGGEVVMQNFQKNGLGYLMRGWIEEHLLREISAWFVKGLVMDGGSEWGDAERCDKGRRKDT